jgi:hypothetical protein
VFGNPATVERYDGGSGAYFSSDRFAAAMPTAELVTRDDVGGVLDDHLRAALLLWTTADSPWVHTVDQSRYLALFASLRELNPALILSTHLPPEARRAQEFFQTLAAAPSATAFTGPDQSALEQMLAGFDPSP